jgi:CRP/FNR family cyclic AMP-dependent transcriptional regulator
LSPRYIGNNWIAQLPDIVQKTTLALMRSRKYSKGDVIYQEGIVPKALWQVVGGSVKLTHSSMDGKEVVFVISETGDCFGELSMIDGKPSSNTAIAAEETALIELKGHDFDGLYNQYPEVAKQLNLLLAERMRHMVSFYESNASRSLEARLAHRLCYLTGNLLGDNSISPSSLEMNMTQQDIGSMLGVTRQAVSKILNHWRDENIVAIEYGKIIIIDPSYLAKLSV